MLMILNVKIKTRVYSKKGRFTANKFRVHNTPLPGPAVKSHMCKSLRYKTLQN